ncbi:DUF4178 domain-containing protein [Tropicibacter naphthalenivorans]|uniref:DUF4178 domain-containing protein n=1 Tax=Tropicibacter naphthalenivorans TaxID=441103 RepID=A0A0P1GKL0_9RHOB|nr:DUF4178 domain-containing protein [Tropicibacter naphthalenivorans]CUH82502.1 hypothetical protein TRN7648_04044 [Tropicibacter naphthalenivorans]SMD06929.1 protein of unknown function [Tropicibacter naphthalenivorans]
MPEFTCPNCGTPVPDQTRFVRMVSCESCGTALLIEDDVVRNAGDSGVMHDTPALFAIGDTIRAGKDEIRIFGQARFSYGRGTWDEFWGLDQHGAPVWVSVDEGDIAVQREFLDQSISPAQAQGTQLGAMWTIDGEQYAVNEKETAECLAIRGSFDHELHVGERYGFFNAQGPRAQILSCEYWEGGALLYVGRWFSPYDIQIEGRA